MPVSRIFLPLAGGVLFTSGMATGLMAASTSDSPQRTEQHRAELSGAEHMQVIVSTAEYQPGETIRRHTHSGLEAVYVVQGASISLADNTTKELKTGVSLLNLRDVSHGGFKVTGDNPLQLFTVHIVDKDAPLYHFE
ncbi:cupin domain-containing protein [Aliiglaciecola sp. CAU 1673]|uniref:cupin domain-containing protein n=1 Tax=Aliiglaciecola sp. CAU 1673 TaxID=3032595 RepID=UPI0023DC6183|nr:cupin domain-containing protein [Aliiglaciecola sp. CAU 1673]MDF2177880.1 cupin domain-containing protein [Aliiglaciecola sp. CAU 1673]